MPNGIYLERAALLDRIQFCGPSARPLNGDQFARGADFSERDLDYARARLERVDRMIAGFEEAGKA